MCHAGTVEKAIEWRLEDIQGKLTDPEKEIVENADLVRKIVQHAFKEVSLEMTLIEAPIAQLRSKMKPVWDMLENHNFKYVFQMVEEKYENFINSSYSLGHYFLQINYYVFHLQTETTKVNICMYPCLIQSAQSYNSKYRNTFEKIHANVIISYRILLRTLYNC